MMAVINFPSLPTPRAVYAVHMRHQFLIDKYGRIAGDEVVDLPVSQSDSRWQEILDIGRFYLARGYPAEKVTNAILRLDTGKPRIKQVDLVPPATAHPWHTILCTTYGPDRAITPFEHGELAAMDDWDTICGTAEGRRIRDCPYSDYLTDILDWHRGYHRRLADTTNAGRVLRNRRTNND